MFELGKNVGYKSDGVFAHKSQSAFGDRQKEARDLVTRSIDEGIPCYGWELEAPEYYVILGYDDIGYHYSGPSCDLDKGPKPWQELGDTGIGLIEMYSVRRGQPADDAKTVKEALQFALEHAGQKWVHPNYKAGLAGFDKWIETMANGTATGHRVAYNAVLWAECRSLGALFLREAMGCLDGKVRPLLDEAIEEYLPVIHNLNKVVDLFPFPPGNEIEDRERQRKSISYLKQAREAEEKGLKSLERIVEVL